MNEAFCVNVPNSVLYLMFFYNQFFRSYHLLLRVETSQISIFLKIQITLTSMSFGAFSAIGLATAKCSDTRPIKSLMNHPIAFKMGKGKGREHNGDATS